MRPTPLLCALAAVAITSLPAVGSADIQGFMKIPNLPGESTVEGHVGEIDLVSYTQTVGSTPANCFVATIIKGLDKASPGLAFDVITNRVLTPVTITLSRVGDRVVDVFTAVLDHAVISTVELVEVDGGPVPTERVVLRARSVALTYHPQNADGTPAPPVRSTISCTQK